MSPLLNLGTFILHFDEVIPAVAANLVVVCEPLDKKAVWSANFPYNATVMLFAIECTPTNQVTFIQFSHLNLDLVQPVWAFPGCLAFIWTI